MKFIVIYLICCLVNFFTLPALDIFAKSRKDKEIKVTLTDILTWLLLVALGPAGIAAFLIVLTFAFIDYVKYHSSKVVWKFNTPKWLKK